MIRRHIEHYLQRAMNDTPVVLLNGARQTGKTTVAQAIAAGAGSHYCTLNDSATLALAVGDPSGLLRLEGSVSSWNLGRNNEAPSVAWLPHGCRMITA
jgi:hypothetical protein